MTNLPKKFPEYSILCKTLNKKIKDLENKKAQSQDETIVEIGSYVGDSTMIFAKRFFNVISIDPFVNGYDDKTY